MTAHLSDSDRQALRLAHDLREELRRALPHVPAAPSISPFVDPGGRPSVLVRMDSDTARALMALLGEPRSVQTGPTPLPQQLPQPLPQQRRADGTVPPPVPELFVQR
ncbi:hypothetical protein BTM25_23380 [Actinomadura rubteroloni]|uniref:Uncharacterized protein n=1 Tax=Actinomadura rubteroloni TaxID=1926885 RepID=A0A2P4UF73_9ACTN|nr:hypothetical protein [Actinomadura rubteroloni]POM23717.1 hypothetical protein BTM25_23380 [Actinomadura rubteroloni]